MSLSVSATSSAYSSPIWRYWEIAQQKQATSMMRLSSGKRVLTAADDAAGLAIAEGLTSQVDQAGVLQDNAASAVNQANIMDGGLSSAQGLLQEMRDTVVGADMNDPQSRAIAQAHIDSLNSQLTGLSQSTQGINGSQLLDGTYSGSFVISDPTTSSPAVLTGPSVAPSALGDGTNTVSGISLTDPASQSQALNTIDGALNSLSSARATEGAFTGAAAIQGDVSSVMGQNLTAARSRIQDADVPSELMSLRAAQTQISMSAQLFSMWVETQKSASRLLG